jgi:hypothetical protein
MATLLHGSDDGIGQLTMAVLNLARFTRTVENFAKNLPAVQVQRLHQAIALEGLTRVVLRTPVDTGRARGNWQVTQGSPASGFNLGAADKNGGGTISAGNSKIAQAKPFTITWITNNLPYIEVLEFGQFEPPNPGPSKQKRQRGKTLVKNGFSVKAPEGMVRVTVAELEMAFR